MRERRTRATTKVSRGVAGIAKYPRQNEPAIVKLHKSKGRGPGRLLDVYRADPSILRKDVLQIPLPNVIRKVPDINQASLFCSVTAHVKVDVRRSQPSITCLITTHKSPVPAASVRFNIAFRYVLYAFDCLAQVAI